MRTLVEGCWGRETPLKNKFLFFAFLGFFPFFFPFFFFLRTGRARGQDLHAISKDNLAEGAEKTVYEGVLDAEDS